MADATLLGPPRPRRGGSPLQLGVGGVHSAAQDSAAAAGAGLPWPTRPELEREDHVAELSALRGDVRAQQVMLAQIAEQLLGGTIQASMDALRKDVEAARGQLAVQQQQQEVQAAALREGLMDIQQQRVTLEQQRAAFWELAERQREALEQQRAALSELSERGSAERSAAELAGAQLAGAELRGQVAELREALGEARAWFAGQLEIVVRDVDAIRSEDERCADRRQAGAAAAEELAREAVELRKLVAVGADAAEACESRAIASHARLAEEIAELRDAVAAGVRAAEAQKDRALSLQAKLAEELATVVQHSEQQCVELVGTIEAERRARRAQGDELRVAIEEVARRVDDACALPAFGTGPPRTEPRGTALPGLEPASPRARGADEPHTQARRADTPPTLAEAPEALASAPWACGAPPREAPPPCAEAPAALRGGAAPGPDAAGPDAAEAAEPPASSAAPERRPARGGCMHSVPAALHGLTEPPRGAERRRALVVACSYFASRAPLHGALNDAWNALSLLRHTLRYAEDQVRLVADGSEHCRMPLDRQPTRANILDGLQWLVRDARPGDELFFYFCGYGAQLPQAHGSDLHEAHLVPADFADDLPADLAADLIGGDAPAREAALASAGPHVAYRLVPLAELSRALGALPASCRATLVLDCCHSVVPGVGIPGKSAPACFPRVPCGPPASPAAATGRAPPTRASRPGRAACTCRRCRGRRASRGPACA
ncbi:unnamed protein product [Prorocentrum cordatum]|uniref:Peptidase C14 caspase domain-containing protein n=1 Tax=Prorocentrum cordatum TaxID=2364126 RepID=A0ABN9UJJ6_9DINO|nr:unnamed protein product [Polarella glacialis]